MKKIETEAEVLARVNDFRKHPFVTDDHITKLKVELLEFWKDSKTMPHTEEEYDHLNLHYEHRAKRPAMWDMAQLVALTQPSSAAAERVFSKYRLLFGPYQKSSLMDVRRLAIQLVSHDRVDRRAGWRGWSLDN